MGAIPLVFEVDGEEIEVEVNPNERLWEVGARVVSPEKWNESLIATTAGLSVDPDKPVKEIVRETGETRFRVLAEGDQGAIPEFPNFLNVTVDSSRWKEREREEVTRIKMLNSLIKKHNPRFAYINPRFYDLYNFKVVKGWAKTNGFGSIEFLVFLPAKYPIVHPETAVNGRFFEQYLKSSLHKHVYPFEVNGSRIPVICGDKKYLLNWSGRLGVAHYISDIVFPWILLESKELAKKLKVPINSNTSEILRILRGD